MAHPNRIRQSINNIPVSLTSRIPLHHPPKQRRTRINRRRRILLTQPGDEIDKARLSTVHNNNPTAKQMVNGSPEEPQLAISKCLLVRIDCIGSSPSQNNQVFGWCHAAVMFDAKQQYWMMNSKLIKCCMPRCTSNSSFERMIESLCWSTFLVRGRDGEVDSI